MTIQTNPNAFAYTFCSRSKSTLKPKLQKELQANTHDSARIGAKLDMTRLRKDNRAADNKVVSGVDEQFESVCLAFGFVAGDREVARKPRLRKPLNR